MARLTVKVIPKSSRNRVVGWLGDALKVTVTAPPEGGRANAAVAELLAKSLDVAASSVLCVAGHGSSRKLFDICGLNAEQVRERLRTFMSPEDARRDDPPAGRP
ncbi:MAG TPA: DUF167 domain-containing protein [Nitrospiria bacterium]|nr:DUF167 domain-containing protein [Nitrospiria bacterium]